MDQSIKENKLPLLLIFIGFLFELSFKIGGVDVLVDFIGYIILFVGLSLIDRNEKWIQISRIVVALLVLVSLFNLANSNFEFLPVLLYDRLAVSINLLLFVNLNLILYFFVIKGYISFFATLGVDKMMKRGKGIYRHLMISRLLYMGLSILWVYTSQFVETTFLAASLTPSMILISVYSLITQITFLYYLYKSYKLISI